ncbi:hypothetical protein, partial [Citrobacter freundii]|uniref:hypothetical protein n=1 Tax=Citrobacter freundii TaxID=546 RepID=UPI00404385B7
HRSVRLVILVGLAIDQIAQSGLSSLSVIYYSAQLFSEIYHRRKADRAARQSNKGRIYCMENEIWASYPNLCGGFRQSC